MGPRMRIWISLFAVFAVAVLAIASLQPLRGARWDLTSDDRFTLSEGTLAIARGLDQPVTLSLYYSESQVRDRQAFRLYAQRVREVVEEVAQRSRGKVRFEVIDPTPFSEQEDAAVAAGLQAVPLGDDEQSLYFGLVARAKDRDPAAMPFIHPDKETFLEYDIATLLQKVGDADKPVLALLGSLNTGPGLAGDGNLVPGFAIDRELSQRYEMRRLQADPSSIGDDVDLLILLHPQALSADTYLAIDQFVLRGGRLLVFVDPYAEADLSFNPLDRMQAEDGKASDLDVLFQAWGVGFDRERVVLDQTYAQPVQDEEGKLERSLGVLGLTGEALNQDDVVTAQLGQLNLSSAGSLERREGSPLRFEPLLQGSGQSMRMKATDYAVSRSTEMERAFVASGDSPVFAVRLRGALKTAFPNRRAEGQRMASEAPVDMIVVADTDLWSDRLWVQRTEFLGQEVLQPFARNADFINNCVENLLGGADLIAVRTRESSARPFTRVEAVRKRAEQRYRDEETRLQESLSKLERELSVMNLPSNTQALTPVQQAEAKRYMDEKLRIRKELRAVRLEMNQDIEALGVRVKLLNIVLVPLLIGLVYLLVVGWRRWRMHES